jgi:hypothetical protein
MRPSDYGVSPLFKRPIYFRNEPIPFSLPDYPVISFYDKPSDKRSLYDYTFSISWKSACTSTCSRDRRNLVPVQIERHNYRKTA